VRNQFDANCFQITRTQRIFVLVVHVEPAEQFGIVDDLGQPGGLADQRRFAVVGGRGDRPAEPGIEQIDLVFEQHPHQPAVAGS
jgi:hypothetical protein